jgi:hypothetical protein
MAFNLIAEFPEEPRWNELQQRVTTLRAIECFPIASDELGPPALGISLTRQAVDRKAWLELERFLLTLWIDHRARVFELYSARELRPEARAELEASLLGPKK